MELSRRVELIKQDSNALADAAAPDLTARIPSCPDWTMADLLRHEFEVHSFWCRHVEAGNAEPEWFEGPYPPDDELVEAFRANALRFADVLGATDPQKPCWTWGPEDNAGFVQRFQVQEVALHRWDAENAVGSAGPIAADGAADSIALFSEILPSAAKGAVAGFEIIATDAPLGMTMSAAPDLPVAGALRGPAGDLLLVLWKRLPLDAVEVTGDGDAITAAINGDRRRLMRTIPELLADAASASPDQPWLVSGDKEFTFAETARLVAAAAAGLAERGVRQGDIVLVIGRNFPAQVFTWLGLAQLGAVMLPVNPNCTADELVGLLEQTQPTLLACDRGRDPVVDEAVARVDSPVTVIDVHDPLRADANDAPRPLIDPRDPVVLIPTSGTTGRSKLVTQTHQGYTLAAEGFPAWVGLTAADRLITALPIFHINAPAYSLLGSMAVGASVVLLERYSPSGFLDAARRFGATEFNTIGAMLEMLMRQPERPDDADTPLRVCYTGPTPPRERQLEIEARFGIEIVCGYGLSESTYGTFWPRGERPYETIGAARQHPTLGHINDARVMDDNAEVAPGAVGELELRNPAIMLGYYGMPDETAEVLVDGWLRTGDLVRRNADETFTFISRKKEVIRRRGENLAPGEVEEALVEQAGVLEAAVVAVPSDLGEDDVKAFVIVGPGVQLDFDALRADLSTRLTRFKIPRFVEVVDELPRTPTGRVAKHQLPRERTPAEHDFEPAP